METIKELRDMDQEDLINQILMLRKQISDSGIDEFKSSAIYNYHFAGKDLTKLNRDRMLGSSVILSLHSISGKPLVRPVSIKDGFSKATINNLLDDLQYSYDQLIEFKPEQNRLK